MADKLNDTQINLYVDTFGYNITEPINQNSKKA